MRRSILVAALAIAASGCTDPHTGQVDFLRTGLLGAGVGAVGGLLGGAVADNQRPKQPTYRYAPPASYGYAPRYERGW